MAYENSTTHYAGGMSSTMWVKTLYLNILRSDFTIHVMPLTSMTHSKPTDKIVIGSVIVGVGLVGGGGVMWSEENGKPCASWLSMWDQSRISLIIYCTLTTDYMSGTFSLHNGTRANSL